VLGGPPPPQVFGFCSFNEGVCLPLVSRFRQGVPPEKNREAGEEMNVLGVFFLPTSPAFVSLVPKIAPPDVPDGNESLQFSCKNDNNYLSYYFLFL
jgi:hypothetical protein